MSYEWFIGLRYLAAKRKQTFISLITWISIGGVAVGVMALITVLAVMTGAQEDMRSKVLGATSHIIITHINGSGIYDSDAVVGSVEEIPGIVAASPFVYNQVMLTSPSRVSGVVLRGIEVDPVTKSSDIGSYLIDGKLKFLQRKYVKIAEEEDEFGLVNKTKRAGIALGNELANILQVQMGDPISIVSPVGGSLTPSGTAPASRDYYVTAIFNTGMYEYDSSLALISIDEAQTLFGMVDRVTGVEAKVEDIYQAGKIAEKIQEVVGFPLIARDWLEMNRNLFFALKLEKTVLGIILTLIIGVAAFNIVSTLIMVVMEKTKDIAILKAMGATRRSIMKIFMLEGTIIGVVGTLLGDIGAVILCELLKRYEFVEIPKDVYNLDTLPVKMETPDVLIVSAVALLITMAATVYPAISASRLDPAEALSYE